MPQQDAPLNLEASNLHNITLAEEIRHLRFLLQESEERDTGRPNTQTINDNELLWFIKRALWVISNKNPGWFAPENFRGAPNQGLIGKTINDLTLEKRDDLLPIQDSKLLDFDKLVLQWIDMRNSPESRPYEYNAPTQPRGATTEDRLLSVQQR